MKSTTYGPVSLPLVAIVLIAFVLAETPLYAAPQQSSQSTSQTQQKDPNASTPTEPSSTSNTATPLPNAPQAAQSSSQQPPAAQSQQQPSTAAPAGAAAARAANVKGVPASEPVGAAIAPPKQHQRRSLIIKLGLAAGAAVAVGSAVALSKASPSRPPGAQASTSHP